MKAAFEAFDHMEACDLCREYVAVMRIITPNSKENKNLCITCAFKEGFIDREPELQKALSAMGITRENAENFNTRVEDFEEMFPNGDMSAAFKDMFGPEYIEKIAERLNIPKEQLEERVKELQAHGETEKLMELFNNPDFFNKENFKDMFGMMQEMLPDSEAGADAAFNAFNPFDNVQTENDADDDVVTGDAIDDLIQEQLAAVHEKLAKPNQQLADLRAKLAAGTNVDPREDQLDVRRDFADDMFVAGNTGFVNGDNEVEDGELPESSASTNSSGNGTPATGGMLEAWRNNPPQLGRFNPFIPEEEQRIGQPLPAESKERSELCDAAAAQLQADEVAKKENEAAANIYGTGASEVRDAEDDSLEIMNSAAGSTEVDTESAHSSAAGRSLAGTDAEKDDNGAASAGSEPSAQEGEVHDYAAPTIGKRRSEFMQSGQSERIDGEDAPDRGNYFGKSGSGADSKVNNNMKLKCLDKYAMNLNQKMIEGKIDVLIDREEELARVIQILNRRSKNNPVLLGEPGVGKTAIAEGLAWAIEKGQVPGKLQDFQVYLLDMTALVAGTQFRGQFETRLKGVVDEVIKVGKIILVIDELHNIMGAGNAEGAMNAANILKPALARGELRVLGSTTLTEYRKTIEKDSALERRFQPVMVEEPDKEATLKMLFGKRPYLEEHHYVVYDDEVCRKTVEFAARYVTDRFFPDKAIDILDEAGSKANLQNEVLTAYQKALKERDTCMQVLQRLEEMVAEDDNTEAVYVLIAENKSKLAQIKSQIEKLKSQLHFTHITVADIAAVIEQWTGIPVKSIDETETERLLHLEERLHQRVIGQNDAISALTKAIKRQRVGLGKRKKPASFIFVGPTGVGKTELVKALAQAMFDAEDAYIRLDMSEYMEAHTVSKMIGSPPGYVGYDDGGQLTEKVRRHPYSVILLDEIEKAHQDVFNILLQILDEGRLTDSHGRQVSFQNTIIIMTSNAGTSLKSASIGFGNDTYVSLERKVDEALRSIFKPEFLNRVDETVVFRPLQAKEIRAIIELMLKEINESLATYNMQLSLTEPVMNLLAASGYDEKYGARPLRKILSRYIEDALADFFLLDKLHNVKSVQVKLNKENNSLCENYDNLIKLDADKLNALAAQLKFYADGKLLK